MGTETKSNRADPVCGTCRRKSRKCDREKPQCRRCLSKGLVCEGYEARFKVYDANASAKKKRLKTSSSVDGSAKSLPSADTTDATGPELQSVTELASHVPPVETVVIVDGSRLATAPEIQDFQSPPYSLVGFNGSTPSQCEASISLLSPSNLEEDEASHIARRQVLTKQDARTLLSHCALPYGLKCVWLIEHPVESISANIIAASPENSDNPFQLYMLPLAYENSSLLHALLGFAAAHISPLELPQQATVAIEHKLLSIQALGSLMLKEQCLGLSSTEEDIALSIVLLLLLQDICESGISSHGAHLNGVVFLCSRIVGSGSPLTPFRKFLIAALSWFDLVRGMSGAEKLAFPSAVRNSVSEANSFDLEIFTGCPKSIFEILGRVLMHGKGFLAGETKVEEFKAALDRSEAILRRWDPAHETYPSSDPAWPLLADAYRHTALLRIIRFPDTFLTPNSDKSVRTSVQRILDISAMITWESPYYSRMLYPLFYAGTDAEHRYQHHYIQVSLEKITQTSGLLQPALLQLLELVWQDRARADGTRNVPWTEYTCSKSLRRQHDYLFF